MEEGRNKYTTIIPPYKGGKRRYDGGLERQEGRGRREEGGIWKEGKSDYSERWMKMLILWFQVLLSLCVK